MNHGSTVNKKGPHSLPSSFVRTKAVAQKTRGFCRKYVKSPVYAHKSSLWITQKRILLPLLVRTLYEPPSSIRNYFKCTELARKCFNPSGIVLFTFFQSEYKLLPTNLINQRPFCKFQFVRNIHIPVQYHSSTTVIQSMLILLIKVFCYSFSQYLS